MKVFLDDLRTEPDGWVRVFWADQAIALLESGLVTDISLDHDLSNDQRGNGYDVLLWIEEAVHLRNFSLPRMQVHSANTSARLRMQAAIASIDLARTRI